jgi:hypothetical protein
MAPFPQNDHSLLPSARADALFMDYGLLFEAMRGRKWVLLPHVISVDGGGAKANLFQVPDGYLIPVTLAGAASRATVTLSRLPEISAGKNPQCEVIHPGDIQWQAAQFRRTSKTMILNVPLRRGCALVRLRVGP